MTNTEKSMMEAMKDGGHCRMILYHPGRQTERPLNFDLYPNESLDPDIARQILSQISGYEAQEIYVNDSLVWQKNSPNTSTTKTITIHHERVKSSF